MKYIIGKSFEGMDKFTLKDIEDIKSIINDTKMTMAGFRSVMSEIIAIYGVDDEIGFRVVQYCVINKDK